ncbi:unnamed protein product [Vitrella brassicaformis CCMP3155]|uniref:Endoplasmic reticulum vesicle transporter C-terminal domain-containing protein n=1 Tax=Vitrella brassicaformis (strain CCMP3155) TaxID=1169540 RepID=A0A0G4ESN9_VITBC|nr:unnamed protein product [Vitrella brassicaformis CCMP3155]|eukprot:CEM00711.1 unnamed protein product [Vitrella brassicaformis CCMP3155]
MAALPGNAASSDGSVAEVLGLRSSFEGANELRRRRGGSGEGEGADRTARVMRALKSFDIYRKVPVDCRVKTQSGGVIACLCWLTIAALFLGELRSFLRVDIEDHIVVDRLMEQKLHIQLNITFPSLRCVEISVDTVDVLEENQVDINGRNIDEGAPRHHGDTAKAYDHVPSPGECLSCFAATNARRKCCNTCQSLKEAYAEEGLSYFDVVNIAPQCQEAIGCGVYGEVAVNKVAGNIHVALGRSTVKNGKHVHEFNVQDLTDGFNTSHTIHTLRFGARVPGVSSPLEGTSRTVHHGAGMFHYYINLVPTQYFPSRGGQPLYTNQYAVSMSYKNVLELNDRLTGLPGVFLVYDLSPFMVNKVERRVPLVHFLTSATAIIGGVFTLSSLLDTLVWSLSRVSLGSVVLGGREMQEAIKYS